MKKNPIQNLLLIISLLVLTLSSCSKSKEELPDKSNCQLSILEYAYVEDCNNLASTFNQSKEALSLVLNADNKVSRFGNAKMNLNFTYLANGRISKISESSNENPAREFSFSWNANVATVQIDLFTKLKFEFNAESQLVRYEYLYDEFVTNEGDVIFFYATLDWKDENLQTVKFYLNDALEELKSEVLDAMNTNLGNFQLFRKGITIPKSLIENKSAIGYDLIWRQEYQYDENFNPFYSFQEMMLFSIIEGFLVDFWTNSKNNITQMRYYDEMYNEFAGYKLFTWNYNSKRFPLNVSIFGEDGCIYFKYFYSNCD